MKVLGAASRVYPPRTIGAGPTMNVAYKDLANIFTAAQETSKATSGVIQTFGCTENSASAQIVDYYRHRNGADGQDGDDLTELQFNGNDDGTPTKTKYARLFAEIVDSGVGSMDGRLNLGTMRGGSNVDWVLESGTLAYQGLTTPTVAGGLNVAALSIANVLQLGNLQYAIWQDQKAAGTDGGTPVADAWTKRTCDDEVVNTIGGLTEAASVFTFATNGTYLLVASAPFLNTGAVGGAQLRWRNTTAGTTVALSSIAYTAATGTDDTCILFAIFTVSGSTNFEIQYYIDQANTPGLGTGNIAASAEVAVFAQALFLRIA